jgi:hypothetical protein
MTPPAKPAPAIEAGPPEPDPDGWSFQLDPPGEAKPEAEHQADIQRILANVGRHSRIARSSEAPNIAVAALDYATRGWSVFPVHGKRRPMLLWQPRVWQSRQASSRGPRPDRGKQGA